MSGERLLKQLAKDNEFLNNQLSLYRLSNSAAIKNLMVRVDLWMRFDPLARPDRFKNNPWYNDEDEPYKPVTDPEVPTYSHARLWTLGLRDVLQDSLGQAYFMKFLVTDYSTENLKFWLAVNETDNIMDRTEFYAKCKEICEQFVVVGSPLELNLLAGPRDKIVEDLRKAESDPKTLDQYVLRDAYEHI